MKSRFRCGSKGVDRMTHVKTIQVEPPGPKPHLNSLSLVGQQTVHGVEE